MPSVQTKCKRSHTESRNERSRVRVRARNAEAKLELAGCGVIKHVWATQMSRDE